LRAGVLLLGIVVAAGVATAARAAQEPGQAGAVASGNQPRLVAAAMPHEASQAPTPSPSAPPTATGTSSKGRQVFLRDCAWCHGEQAQGTGVAPSLRDKGAATIDFWLSTGRMPLASPDQQATSGPPSYDAATIRSIVGYVGSLGVVHEPIPQVRPGDVAEGQSLFITHCAACHSSSGTGVIVVDGKQAPQLWGTPPTQVAEAIRTGPGEMPPFSSEEVDETQLDDLVSYVSSLGSPQVKGGSGLDQFGPIFEGSIAWLIPVPVLIVVLLLLGQRRKKE
jgi:ubiquinol-cytochrome c reductase cytochrome c subunit